MAAPNLMNFRKSSKRGGGVIFNPKIYIADFCHYRRYFGHEFQEKFAILFSENEGGGGDSKAVWNFSENSSILEGKGVPNHHTFITIHTILAEKNCGCGGVGGWVTKVWNFSYFLNYCFPDIARH